MKTCRPDYPPGQGVPWCGDEVAAGRGARQDVLQLGPTQAVHTQPEQQLAPLRHAETLQRARGFPSEQQ